MTKLTGFKPYIAMGGVRSDEIKGGSTGGIGRAKSPQKFGLYLSSGCSKFLKSFENLVIPSSQIEDRGAAPG